MLYTMLAVAMLGAAPSLGATGPGVMPPHAARITALALRHTDRPGIRVWSTHDEVYRRGERARIYFRTERDAFVTIFRIDTDGRVRVLYPRDPWDDNSVRGGASYVVSSWSRGEAFVVDDDPGVGYVFGVAASDPFNYGAIAGRERWELYRVGDRVHSDPFAGAMDIVDHLLPPDYADYDTHLLPYYVERRYDYPRFVCYDCHSYVGFSLWNPYVYHCSRFSLWVYNDPFYYYPSYWYPTRYYGGARVVIGRTRSTGYAGRYVLADGSVPCGFGQVLELPAMRRLTLDDGVLGGALVLTASVPLALTARPHHTVSQSEAGFEKIMQAVEIMLSWPVAGEGEIAVGLAIVPHGSAA